MTDTNTKYDGMDMEQLRTEMATRGIQGRGRYKQTSSAIKRLLEHDAGMAQMDPSLADNPDSDTSAGVPASRDEKHEVLPPDLELKPSASNFRVEKIQRVVELAPRPKPSKLILDDTQYRVMEPAIVGDGRGFAMRLKTDDMVSTKMHPHLREWVDSGLKVEKAGAFRIETDSLGVRSRVVFE